jgi:hypothetical protein
MSSFKLLLEQGSRGKGETIFCTKNQELQKCIPYNGTNYVLQIFNFSGSNSDIHYLTRGQAHAQRFDILKNLLFVKAEGLWC